MKKVLLALLIATCCPIARAAIQIGPNGSGVLTFNSTPAPTEFSTGVLNGDGTTYADAASLDAGVNTLSATAIVRTLPTSTTQPPSTFSGGFRHNNGNGGFYLQSRPTTDGTNAANVLLATLQNTSGGTLNAITISYAFNVFNPLAGELPGFRVYFSLSGTPGTWQFIPGLSDSEVIGTYTTNVFLGGWPSGAIMYLLWADDNANTITDPSYTIDDFLITPAGVDFAAVTAPTNNAVFPQGVPIVVNASVVMNNVISNVTFFQDGLPIGNDATAPFSVVSSNAPLGIHTFTVTATDSTGATVSSSNLVRITVVSNNPPTINITAPQPGQNFLVGQNITNTVAVADSDGVVVGVEFYVDGVFRYVDNAPPFRFEWCDALVGAHSILAVAIDNGGFRGSNTVSISVTNPPDTIVIVPNGSTWKYLDDGSDQGNGWRFPGFDDSSWSNGVAELGYGDITEDRPERTQVGFGGNPNLRFATTYFRKTFNVSDPSSFTNIILRVLRDDTAIVYLNGVQVYIDTTNAPVDFSTYAGPTAADDGTVYQVTAIPVGLLFPGQNVLAAEIHQSATNSSDLSFDIMLWGQGGAPFLKIALDPTNNANGKVDWAPANWHLQSTPNLGQPTWTDVMATPPFTFSAPSGTHFYRTVSPDGTMCSPNVVGSVTLTMFPGNNLIGNPLNGTNNHLNTILPLSNDGTQDGTTILRFDPVIQGFSDPITWFAGIGWDSGNPAEDYILKPGEGFYLQNPSPGPLNVVMVGEVPQGTLTNPIPANMSLRSSQVPVSAPLSQLAFPAIDGDLVSIFDPATQNYTDYNYFDGVGWDPGNPQGPTIPVGGGFALNNPAGPRSWVRNFGISCGQAVLPPQITQQPQNRKVLAGTDVTFSVGVTGSPPFMFQWFFKGSPIPGATNSSYTLTNARLTNAGPFQVAVFNSAGGTNSASALLTVYGPVVINEWMALNTGAVIDPADGHPDDWFELYNAGNTPVALGGFHLTDQLTNTNKFAIPAAVVIPAHGYLQFWADNQPAQGPLHVNFVLPNNGGFIGLFDPAGLLMDGVNFGPAGTNTSEGRLPDGGTNIVVFNQPSPAGGNGGGPPMILGQPFDQVVPCFGTATFAVSVGGSMPASFKWVRNGCDVVPGANGPLLTLNNVRAGDAGNYSLIISNEFGQVASDDASLIVVPSATPALTLAGKTNAVISWPLSCPDFVLERSTDLQGLIWGNAGQVTQNGSNYTITIPLGTNAESVFYRLHGSDSAFITTQPKGRALGLQDTADLTVGTGGAIATAYQWRHNGRAIPGQTNSTLSLAIAGNTNYGAYEVLVFDQMMMAHLSNPAFIRPSGQETALADNFDGRPMFTNLSGSINGTTAGATLEAGEPQHINDVPGGKSVWFGWRPPASGIATFDTIGSGFDTLVAVYRGSNFATLAPVASDDDGAGLLWSKISFNVTAGVDYAIALDGAAGTSGYFLLNWDLEITSASVPVIQVQPQQIVVLPGQQAVFSVTATSAPPFANLSYQWFRGSTLIPGINTPQLVIDNVQADSVDEYYVVVNNGVRTVESRHAILQMSTDPADFHAEPKMLLDFVCGSGTDPTAPDQSKAGHPKVIAPSTSGSLTTSATPYNPPTGLTVCCLPTGLSPAYYTLVTVTTSGTCPSTKTSDLTFSISGMTSIAALIVFENSCLSVPAKACATTINPTVTVAAKRNTSYSAVVVTGCSGACFSINYANGPCK